MLNETHDPLLRSWVTSANSPGGDFPIQNLPFGLFRRSGSQEPLRCGVAIGDQILDLCAAVASGELPLSSEAHEAARSALVGQGALNALMAAGPLVWSALRLGLSRSLRAGAGQQAQLRRWLLPVAEAELAVPAHIGDYTDFYTSIYHATTVGRLFRPNQPLLPNYQWIPIGYHGRSSSIGISGQQFARPWGQQAPMEGTAPPTLGPSLRLDYELELGIFIGAGNPPGSCISVDQADAHVFGVCLLNDWSARDLQTWESQPLGPFLAKNFATTISPWIVTLEALEPYRSPWTRAASDPQPLPYLDAPSLRERGAIDIELQVQLQTDTMRRSGQPPLALSLSNFRDCYWSVAQMIAHHTINGCNLRPGDLLGSGTQSGPQPEAAGSLLELTRGGRERLRLPNGEQRGFLEDGDTIILRGWCERAGAARIGLGEAVGRVLPAAR